MSFGNSTVINFNTTRVTYPVLSVRVFWIKFILLQLLICGADSMATINTFDNHDLYGAGVATPDPGEAPPLAG